MVVMILCVLVGIYAAYKFIEDGFGEFWEYVVALFIFATTALTAALVITIPAGSMLPKTTEFTNTELVALQDGSGSKGGTFFLGTGYVGSTMKYNFYKSDGAAKKLESIDSKDVRLFEDTNTPYVRQITGCNGPWEWLVPCFEIFRVVEIHVPKNTIKTDLVLDAKS